nr:uncharacterized protein LOC128697908 [Cherax quadricarinatus]
MDLGTRGHKSGKNRGRKSDLGTKAMKVDQTKRKCDLDQGPMKVDQTKETMCFGYQGHERDQPKGRQCYLVNAGVCVAAQKVLLDLRDGVKHEVMSRHKRDLRAAVSLLPLEGVSWFLAVVALEDHQSLALDCAAALVTAALGWLVLYFHGWSWRCHGLCWLRRQMAPPRRLDDLSLPLTARYDHDLAHQPLLPPHAHPAVAHPASAPHHTVTVAPPAMSSPPVHPEEFPLQPLFPLHERRETY